MKLWLILQTIHFEGSGLVSSVGGLSLGLGIKSERIGFVSVLVSVLVSVSAWRVLGASLPIGHDDTKDQDLRVTLHG